jgi:polyisoprenoid-binding protein YceI
MAHKRTSTLIDGAFASLPSTTKGDAMSVLQAADPILVQGQWEVDPAHSVIEFAVRYMLIATVKGRFSEFEGTIDTGESPTFRGVILAATVDTNHGIRDDHLRSADFFDAARYPEISFSSTAVDVDGPDSLSVIGDLELRGVTRPIALAGEVAGVGLDPDGVERLGLNLRGELDRRDFGLTWNQALETGGLLVGDRVGIELDVSAVRVA